LYCRYPDIHGDDVVFVADDDIWLGSVASGRAQRLSNDHVPCANPCFSPDGTRIAWTSAINGEPDTYLLSDGAVTRLTWFGSTSVVAGWIDDQHVLVASGHQEVFAGLRRLYSVALDGTWQKLPLGPAMGGAWGPDGRRAINTPNNRESSYWKRYRGGTASALWADAGDSWREILPDEPAGKYAPGWVGNRLIFTSDLGAGGAQITDAHAQAQLYSVADDGADLRQHTHHTMAQGYVRDARTDGTRVVYHARGVLYLIDALGSEPRPIGFDLGVTQPAPEDIDGDKPGSISVDQTGTGSLVEWHGAAYFVTHRAGPARALTDDGDARRVRLPVVLGKQAVMVTDADGDDALEVAPLDGLGQHRRLAGGQLGRVVELVAAPDGNKVAVATHDGRVLCVDTETGGVVQAGQVTDDCASGLAFSPDSRYLVWSENLGRDGADSARLCCADLTQPDQPAVALTSGAFYDYAPAFTRDGKYLAWLSSRNYDPQYSDFGFYLSFRASDRVVMAPLSATEPLPFGVSADGWPVEADDKDSKSDKDDKDAKVICELEPAGFEARSVALPVPAGDYSDLAAVSGGLAWLCSPDRGGQLGSTWAGAGDAPSDRLQRFAFSSRKVEVLADKADMFDVSGDGSRIVVSHHGDLTVIPADRKLDDDDDARIKVDLARLRRRVDRRQQWHQMLDETHRLMAQHYWRADLNGLDWPGVLDSYRPVIDKAMTDSDVYDILYELVAEMNTSHSYVMPPEPEPDPTATGYLGVETRRVEDGFEITRVLPGEPGDPKAWAPMLAAGVGAQAGDVIVAIDGRPASEAPALGALLVGAAGQTVEVTLRRDKTTRRVAVVTLRSEAALRYQDWVAARAAHVEEASGGRLGYVHVPDMMSVGWAQLERRLGQASQHDGVIADMRYNRGGHTSELVINRLTQKVLGWDTARHYSTASTYPIQAMRGPVVLLANQWSGSDGDIVTGAAKLHDLPVVGMRTWGGVIGIDSRYSLVDGTTVTQPRYSFYFEKLGWGLENHGVDPDVEVKLAPDQWQSEDDAQLDVAIKIALERLAQHPAAQPPAMESPKF